jgi:hypothetical protein
MQIQPHENLAVQSVRHGVLGHDRYSPILVGHGRAARLHGLAHERLNNLDNERLHASAEHRPERLDDRAQAVSQTHRAQPADCYSCGRGSVPESSEYVPYMPGVWQTQAPQSDPPVTVIVIYDKTAISQGFTHGQSIPAAGSLLDIFA